MMLADFVYSDDVSENLSDTLRAPADWTVEGFHQRQPAHPAAPRRRFFHGSNAHAAATTPAQVLYLQEPGTTSPISPDDIYQAGLGDCFLLSAIGEIAMVDPTFIQNNLIHSATGGTETVTLYEDASGKPASLSTTSFKPVHVAVNNHFDANAVNSQTTKDTYNGQQEIWPQVIEQAYANLNGGYGAIGSGGYDMVAMETLTGQSASYIPTATANLSSLQNQAANTIMEFDTNSGAQLGYHLVNDHAYMFDGFQTQNDVTMVKLLNPWGTNEPDLVPWAQVAQNFSGITVGHV